MEGQMMIGTFVVSSTDLAYAFVTLGTSSFRRSPKGGHATHNDNAYLQ